MISHVVSVLSATWTVRAQSLDQGLLIYVIPACNLLNNCQMTCMIPACSSAWQLLAELHDPTFSSALLLPAEQHDSWQLSPMIIACVLRVWCQLSSLIIASWGTTSVHDQSHEQDNSVTWSLHVQLPHQFMIIHVISAWSDMWSVYDQPRDQCMLSHVISAW